MKSSCFRLLLPALLSIAFSLRADPPSDFQNEIVVVGLDQPSALEFLPDGRLLVAELQEEILVVQPDAGVPDAKPFLHLDNTGIFGGQGLMDIELDPEFDANGYYYVFYTKGSLNRNRVSRFTASGNETVDGSEVVLWQGIEPALDEHQGGAVAFGPDGKLYISVGEAFVPEDAQKLTSYRGKILRINKDGTVPTDNPFHDGAGPNLDAIWAYGLRNPFRISFDSLTGRMFIGEVGGNDPAIAQEEINLGIPGANYGWPECEGACGTPGFTSPIYYYPHAGRDACAIGGFVYRGNKFPNAYFGSYFFADYAQNWIRRLTFDTNGAVRGVFNFEPADGSLDADIGDPTGLKEGPDGSLYYTDFTHDSNFYWAMVRRIRYVGSGNQAPVAFVSATPTAGDPPLTVAFSSAGSADPEGHALAYNWTFGDNTSSTNANPIHTYLRSGTFAARLVVSDGVNTTMSAPLSIVAGNPPTVVIDAPANGLTFRAGDIIQFAGHATDAEDGALAARAMDWSLVFHHGAHIHPVFGDWSATNRGSLVIPETGHPFGHDTSYELALVATDSSGLQGSASVVIYPDLVDISVDSVPTGLTLKMDGISRVTPFTDGSVIGFQHSLEAGDQAAFGTNYIFETWNDGGRPVRSVTVPEQNLSLSAHFRAGAPGELLIQLAAIEGNGFRIRFNTQAGRTYVVEHSPTMAAGTWTPAGDVVIGTGSSVEVLDPIGDVHPSGFYRVTVQPSSIPTGVPGCVASVEAHGLDVKSMSVDVPSTGDNRLLLVGICWIEHESEELPIPMLGGVPLTQVVVTNWFYGSGKLAWYALTAPPVGTQELQVSFATAVAELAVVGMVFTNVDQFVSLGEPASEYAVLPVSSIAIDVPSTTNDLVVDLLGYYAYDPVPGTGQSFRQASINSGNASAQTSVKPGQAVSTSMSWSLSDATEISLLGIAVKGR